MTLVVILAMGAERGNVFEDVLREGKICRENVQGYSQLGPIQ